MSFCGGIALCIRSGRCCLRALRTHLQSKNRSLEGIACLSLVPCQIFATQKRNGTKRRKLGLVQRFHVLPGSHWNVNEYRSLGIVSTSSASYINVIWSASVNGAVWSIEFESSKALPLNLLIYSIWLFDKRRGLIVAREWSPGRIAPRLIHSWRLHVELATRATWPGSGPKNAFQGLSELTGHALRFTLYAFSLQEVMKPLYTLHG